MMRKTLSGTIISMGGETGKMKKVVSLIQFKQAGKKEKCEEESKQEDGKSMRKKEKNRGK